MFAGISGIISWSMQIKRRVFLRLNGVYTRAKIRLLGGKCGSNLLVDRDLLFKYPPHKGIQIGRFVTIGKNIVIDVPPGGCLILGDRVKLTMDTILAASERVEIGEDTQVAEFVSIRDADHGTFLGSPMSRQNQISDPVHIGKDVWIARGAAILKGANVGDGVVVGANSVVKGAIPSNAIAVGTPAKVVKFRSGVEEKNR